MSGAGVGDTQHDAEASPGNVRNGGEPDHEADVAQYRGPRGRVVHSSPRRDSSGVATHRRAGAHPVESPAGGDTRAWAQQTAPGAPVRSGPLGLQPVFNSGVAFSIGDDAPAWMVIAATGLVTVAVAVALWRTAPTASRLRGTALSLVLGGAAANLIDRAADGYVTDYLHTGWWPTFNLADVFVMGGGLLLLATSWRADTATENAGTRHRSRPHGGRSFSGARGPRSRPGGTRCEPGRAVPRFRLRPPPH
ncbi:signal peptidase II [Streptomyces sp. NPDC058304]|uniref:signal peptidase II n=1 Tax=Streptomyces sp. NPDC058304 TaxID=3346437 RepID=UPI0036E17EF6